MGYVQEISLKRDSLKTMNGLQSKWEGFYEVYNRMDATSSKDPRLFKQQSQKQNFKLHPK